MAAGYRPKTRRWCGNFKKAARSLSNRLGDHPLGEDAMHWWPRIGRKRSMMPSNGAGSPRQMRLSEVQTVTKLKPKSQRPA